MKILFLGSSRFSLIVLQKMLEEGIDVCTVITQPDRPSGRGHKLTPTEVKTFALERGIEVKTFDKLRLHMDEVKAIDFDLSVVASFGQILPNEFLEHRLCINVHPSLLPKYRGASPIQSAILNGDKQSGVSIMKVAQEVDAGDIILQKQVAVENEYYLQLEDKLAKLGGEMVAEVVKNYQKGQITFTPQQHEKAVKVGKFSKEDGLLDFSLKADELVCKVRALSEEVGTYFVLNQLNIKVEKLENVSDEFQVEQGKVLNNKKHFVIGCKNGAVEIVGCKAPSGKSVSGRDFLNGHNDLLGKKVENA